MGSQSLQEEFFFKALCIMKGCSKMYHNIPLLQYPNEEKTKIADIPQLPFDKEVTITPGTLYMVNRDKLNTSLELEILQGKISIWYDEFLQRGEKMLDTNEGYLQNSVIINNDESPQSCFVFQHTPLIKTNKNFHSDQANPNQCALLLLDSEHKSEKYLKIFPKSMDTEEIIIKATLHSYE